MIDKVMGAVDDACRCSKVGKLLPGDLYVHADYVKDLAEVLIHQVFQALRVVGSVPYNIVKIGRRSPVVSLLYYPGFETEAHPELCESVRVEIVTGKYKKRRYAGSSNPPILHRKECFVLPSHPGYDGWVARTKAEEKLGLYEDTSRIGFKRQWDELVKSKGGAR